jgi:phosphoribosylglycinamide formyltransferase-1
MAQTLAVLASGGGTNFQAILDAIAEGRLDSSVVLVASNREDAGALERGRQAGLRAEWVEPGPDYNERLHALLTKADPDLVVLAGYLKLIGVETVRQWGGAILNIHPALLPSFGGKGMYGIHVHEAVLERGVRVTGVTVHLVDEEYDRGPIVAQIPVPVLDDDTPQQLQARVLEWEHRIYPQVLRWFAEGRVQVEGRRVRILKEEPNSN